MRSALIRKYSWLQAHIATVSSHSRYGAKTPGSASLQRKSRHYTSGIRWFFKALLNCESRSVGWRAKIRQWTCYFQPRRYIWVGDHRKYMLLWRVQIGGDCLLTAGGWSSWVSPSNRWRERNLKRCFSSPNSRHLVSQFAVRANTKILLELHCCDFQLQSHIIELDREPPG